MVRVVNVDLRVSVSPIKPSLRVTSYRTEKWSDGRFALINLIRQSELGTMTGSRDFPL